jgi:SET domain-containing protein
MKSLNQLTYISESKIHGQGLFARKSIKKGRIIGRLQGKPCAEDGRYVLWLNENQGLKVSCNLKFINHSDQPNACYYDDMTVVALRKISQDEEITHDYESADW